MKTARDVVDNLMDFLDAVASGNSVRQCRESAQEGLRDLGNAAEWSYYKRLGRVDTSAYYATGTVAFDYTGGTYERMLTLSSGTWPTWAAKGVVIISGVPYQVDEYKTSTIVTLTAATNPGQDVAAGTSYAIYRDHFDLPTDFKAMLDPVVVTNNRGVDYLPPDEFFYYQSRHISSAGQPRFYTITGDPDNLGPMVLYLHPYPDSTVYHVDFAYHARPRAISVFDYHDGAVTTSSGSATLTGVGTAWTSRMDGSVIRISDVTNKLPTGLEGDYPYIQESRILQVVSATSLRMSAAAAATYTAVKHLVADPIDVEDGVMMNAYLRACERALAVKRRLSRKDEVNAEYINAVQFALSADRRALHTKVVGRGGHSYSIKDMPLSTTNAGPS